MKKQKMSPKWKNRIWNGSMIAAFLAAIAVFVFLLQTEKKVLAEYEKQQVCVVAEEIPRGKMITEENVHQYVTVMEIDKRIVPETALEATESVIGKIPVCGIEKGTVLTTGLLQEAVEITGEMNEPVIAGFRAEDLYQVAGGVLRAGDRIHIYCVNQEKEAEAGKILWENVYVQEVFDQTGTTIEGNDNTTPAQRINIYLDKAHVAEFYTELAQGSLRAVKVCDSY